MKNENKYLMIVGTERVWLDIYSAAVAYDNSWTTVSIGGQVQDVDGVERPITEEERNEIVRIADEYSFNK